VAGGEPPGWRPAAGPARRALIKLSNRRAVGALLAAGSLDADPAAGQATRRPRWVRGQTRTTPAPGVSAGPTASAIHASTTAGGSGASPTATAATKTLTCRKKEMTSADVLGKREAAKRWANYVSADASVGTPWRYLLVSESDVAEAKGSWPAFKKLGQ
jgi:hypothetical protein